MVESKLSDTSVRITGCISWNSLTDEEESQDCWVGGLGGWGRQTLWDTAKTQ